MHREQKPRVYFSVPKGHAFAKQLATWDAQWKVAVQEREALLASLHLPEKTMAVSCDTRLVGFTTNPSSAMVAFVREHSDTWRWVRVRCPGFDYATARKTGPGKPIAAKIAAAPQVGFDRGMIEQALGIPDTLWIDGLAIVSISLYRVKGGQPMLGVPWVMYQKHKAELTGLKELTTSKVAEIMDASNKEQK